MQTGGVAERSHDLTGIVDAEGSAFATAGHVNEGKVSVAQQKSMHPLLVGEIADDVTWVVDVEQARERKRAWRTVNRDEVASL